MIYWKVSNPDLQVASVRYRVLLPKLALEKVGITSQLLFTDRELNIFEENDTVIFVKAFSIYDLILAHTAKSLGCRILIDLCDNIFIDSYVSQKGERPDFIFKEMALLSTAVITTGDELARIIRKNAPSGLPVYVVPDGVERFELVERMRKERQKSIPSIFLGNVQRALRLSPGLRTSLSKICRSIDKKRFQQKFFRVLKIVKTQIRGNFISLRNRFSLKYLLKIFYRTWKFVQSYAQISHTYSRKQFHVFNSIWGGWKSGEMSFTGLKLSRSNPAYLVQPFFKYDNSKRVNINHSGEAIQKKGKPKHILWFGNHGAAHADFGIRDILLVKTELERLAKKYPIQLNVVSNNRQKYDQLIAPLSFDSRYYEWNMTDMAKHFAENDVVIVPNNKDDFSKCKSANRVLLALDNCVPVVASLTPATEKLKDCVILDDWEGGIECYLTRPSKVRSDIKKAGIVIEEEYSWKVIASKWKTVIRSEIEGSENHGNISVIALCLQLITDLDLIFPFIETQVNSIQFVVIVHDKLALKRPDLIRRLSERGVTYRIYSERFVTKNPTAVTSRFSALVCPTETNLRPHRFARTLTNLMKNANRRTYTMQHGHENVGLTYSDNIHPISKVSFESDLIFIWGELNTLLPNIPLETKKKCVPAGFIRPARYQNLQAAFKLPGKRFFKFYFGYFENLHWHRYSENYINSCVRDLEAIIREYPEVLFVVKPHPAGRWLVERYDGTKPSSENVIIVESGSQLGQLPIFDLMLSLDAVITTPSTTAVDAAQFGLPIAILEYGMDFHRYEPLYKVKSLVDCRRFIEGITLASTDELSLTNRASLFMRDYVKPMNAAQLITERILNDVSNV